MNCFHHGMIEAELRIYTHEYFLTSASRDLCRCSLKYERVSTYELRLYFPGLPVNIGI